MQSFISVLVIVGALFVMAGNGAKENHFMSDAVILARLVRINDHLIELLKWAMESGEGTRLCSATGTDHENLYFYPCAYGG